MKNGNTHPPNFMSTGLLIWVCPRIAVSEVLSIGPSGPMILKPRFERSHSEEGHEVTWLPIADGDADDVLRAQPSPSCVCLNSRSGRL